MSQWTEKQAEIRAALKGTSAVSHSKSDLVDLTQALMNSPEEDLDVYVKDGDGYGVVKSNPAKDFRTSLKRTMIEQFGIDKAEATKLDTLEFSKATAEAVDGIAMHAIKAYMEAGRKLVFPCVSADDARMGISITETPEKKSESVQFITKEDGSTEKVGTGKYVTTKAHKSIKAHNKVPEYMKSHE